MNTSTKPTSKAKPTKTIPKGFRSHESARSNISKPKSFFTQDHKSPPRQISTLGKRDDKALTDEKSETSSCVSSLHGSAETSPRSLSHTRELDETIDAGMLEDDNIVQVIDTSDLDFSRSDDLCSHSNVTEKDGVVICEDCGQELYNEEPSNNSKEGLEQDSWIGGNFSGSSSSSSACDHQNVVKEKGVLICEDCGEELYEEISHDQEWRKFGDFEGRGAPDPTRCQYRKAAEKGIRKELERMGFAPDICKLADKDYMLITKEEIKRSELRKGIIFACVLEAHKRVGRHVTPDEIASKFFNLQRKTQSQGLQFYRLRCPRSYFQYEDISAKHFIPQIMKMPQFNTKSEHIDRVIMLHERIADKCSVLNRSNPQSVSKALIYYYFRRRGVLISPSRFGKIVSLSHVILLRLSSAISQLLGTGKTVSLI